MKPPRHHFGLKLCLGLAINAVAAQDIIGRQSNESSLRPRSELSLQLFNYLFNIRQLVGGSKLGFSIKIFAIWKCQSYLKLNLIKQRVLIKMFGMLSILYILSIAQSSARLFEGLSLSKLIKLQHTLDHVLQDAQDILRKRSDHHNQMRHWHCTALSFMSMLTNKKPVFCHLQYYRVIFNE